MPSWNEKPHVVPTINVNTKPCSRGRSMLISGVEHHANDCAGRPVRIPCPLRRSVTFEVRLGECGCDGHIISGGDSVHAPDCPARPVKVFCSISGKTWEESDISDVEFEHENAPVDHARCEHLAAERWALVKALVLGKDPFPDYTSETEALVTQREAVYAALAKVATLERAIFDAQGDYMSAMDEHHHGDWHRDPESHPMPSQWMLALYVSRLIEQMGAL